MRPSTVVRLALAGNRTDLLRTVLTGLSAALAVFWLLAAVVVHAIRGDDPEHYTNALFNESGLRFGVVIALVLLAVPVIALAGQCIRLGAPARDRRLAAIRLAGATPGQAVLVATAETAIAGFLGAVGGVIAYQVMRTVLDRRDRSGRLVLPTDVRPPVLAIVGLLVLVPLVAALIGGLLMRRVIVTPLGVVRHERLKGPQPWPGLLIAAGIVLFWLPTILPVDALTDSEVRLTYGVGMLLTSVGVVSGIGWISYTSGRLLIRFGRGPSALLGGRRLMADPWHGSRTLAALLTAVIIGSVGLGYRAVFLSQASDDIDFYLGGVRLVEVAVAVGIGVAAAGLLVALAESIVSRRRTYASLTAAGVPRRTLAGAVLWQSVLPLVPAVTLALSAGVTLARAVTGSYHAVITVTDCADANTCRTTVEATQTTTVPLPIGPMALLGLEALVAVLIVVGAGLLVLRSSTDLEELRV